MRNLSKSLSILFLFASSFVKAQMVGSKAFSLMLSGLLSDETPTTDVYEVADSSDVYFLDARQFKEYQVSHIKGATWVGYEDFSLARVPEIPKNEPIIVYCSVGYRSEKITEKLMQAGFTNVKNLYGGIFEWVNAGKPVYNGTQVTDSVHAYDHLWGVWLTQGKKVYE